LSEEGTGRAVRGLELNDERPATSKIRRIKRKKYRIEEETRKKKMLD
jgi:hypothetical protein